MELVIQLVLAVAVFGVTLSGGSLLWPKMTSQPRPQLLQQVHDSVVQTPVGAQAAAVLGVSDEASVQQINLGQVAGTIGNSIKTAAQNRAQTIIMAQVRQQLTSQYNKLPKKEQKEFQELICK